MSNVLKINLKYRKSKNGFDFDLSFGTNLKNFHRIGNKKINDIVKLGIIIGVAYTLEIISLGF